MSDDLLRFYKDGKSWVVTDANGNKVRGATKDIALQQYKLIYELGKPQSIGIENPYGYNPFQE